MVTPVEKKAQSYGDFINPQRWIGNTPLKYEDALGCLQKGYQEKGRGPLVGSWIKAAFKKKPPSS